jgi:hypothetical protein
MSSATNLAQRARLSIPDAIPRFLRHQGSKSNRITRSGFERKFLVTW